MTRHRRCAQSPTTGTPDDVAQRLDALLQAGLKQAVLFPVSADGDAKAAIVRTIELLS